MKLFEALQNVDKSEPDWVAGEDLYESFGLHPDYGQNDELEKRLKAYWLIRWCCTDTWVGVRAIFLDDELVGMSKQTARKNRIDYQWLSAEVGAKVRDLLMPPIADSDILQNEDASPFFSVNFTGQILEKEGFYQGRPVKFIRDADPKNYTSKQIIVEEADGVLITIPVEEFRMPLRTRMTLRTAFTGTTIPAR